MPRRIYGTRLDWSKLVSGWANQRALDLRAHADKIRRAYKAPNIRARMEPYAAALDRAAAVIEASALEVAAITDEPANDEQPQEATAS